MIINKNNKESHLGMIKLKTLSTSKKLKVFRFSTCLKEISMVEVLKVASNH